MRTFLQLFKGVCDVVKVLWRPFRSNSSSSTRSNSSSNSWGLPLRVKDQRRQGTQQEQQQQHRQQTKETRSGRETVRWRRALQNSSKRQQAAATAETAAEARLS